MKLSNKFNFIVLKDIWNKFRDIPVNENDEIDIDFYIWKKGTDKFLIWHWFDERCPNNLHDDLMFIKEK